MAHSAWYAMVADVLVRYALVTFRFNHGGWKRIEV
jgi:Na+-driven multidrug efflux pump